jgi:hypothetical protein
MKAAKYIPLVGGAAVALLIAAAAPALASPAAHHASGGSISAILTSGDIVTGVRGALNGNVVLTGSALTGVGSSTAPFLYRGRLRGAAGAAVTELTPPFAGETSATFYGPDTHAFNPAAIPAGQVRAVGSYQSSDAAAGVINQGMIYAGPISGRGGRWRSIAVPAHGSRTAGHRRACPRSRCRVMDTIAHSTMGDLVVGDYDLNPRVRGGLLSANAFIYNIITRRWTLLDLGHSQSSATTAYAIWQDGGAGSHTYTLAGGTSANGPQQAYLMTYNERTGAFGTPRFYSYGNRPASVTHFEGITAVRGGFNLVAISSAQAASMVFVPASARHGYLGRARWYPVNVAASSLCSGSCSVITGNTVYKSNIMGLYVRSSTPRTYLASVPGR